MLKPALFALAALTSLGVAQSPLVTLNLGGNSGNVGGGLYFDLQINTTVTLTQLDIRTQTGAASTFMDIYLGPSTYVGNVTNPALWTLVSTTNPTTSLAGGLTTYVITSPFALGPGNYGVALKSNATSFSYTNGAGNNPPLTCGAVPGSCLNSIFSNAEMTLRAGAAQNAFLQGGIFSPRVINCRINYTPGGNPIAVASWQKYGGGCYNRARSFYEFWPSSVPFDFGTVTAGGSGITSMRLTFAGNRYLVTPGTTAMYTHSPGNVPLGLGDDVEQPIPLDPLSPTILFVNNGVPTNTAAAFMCSNGFLSLGASNAALVTLIPAVNPFLGSAPLFGNWHDLDPSQVGAETRYEYDATLAGGAHVFSWLNCPDWNIAGSSNNFQLLFYNNGDTEYRWGNMSQSGGGGWPTVMGHGAGGTARNDGGWDLSVRLGGPTGSGFLTGDIDNAPLDLAMSARPVLGTAPVFTTSGLEPSQAVGLLLINFLGIPGGMPIPSPTPIPECLLYVGLPGAINLFWFSNPPGTPAGLSFPIPNSAGLNGVTIYGQSAALGSSFNTAYSVGVNASNGVRLALGSL